MSQEKRDQLCLSCHKMKNHLAHWENGAHNENHIGCLDCHKIHNGTVTKLLINPDVNELCLNCHKKQSADFRQRSHHPVKEGKMNCADCHNPHGSQTKALIGAASINDKCLSCHTEFKAPMLYEHPPVKEDCMICHKPHGSNNETLLKSKQQNLCQKCHLHGRHQSKVNGVGDIWLLYKGCTNCHSNIHGSNHPSGILFQR